MKIWVDENIPLGKEAFEAHGEAISFPGRTLTREDIRDADALIVRSVTRVGEGLLAGTRVRFVGTATIGTDHVDQAYLKSRGIGFASSPGCNANSVGEYVAAALCRLEERKGFSPAGKVLGLIGHGHVGKQVERKALALGMSVLLCDPPLREKAENPSRYCGRDELLEGSDVVSLHVPLVADGPHPTLNMADAGFFDRLGKPTALINTCRGEVIRETALHAALDAGRISHLVLDVFAGEPRIDPALCARADLITPHIAGYSLQGKLNGTQQVARAFRRFFGFASDWAPSWAGPQEADIAYPPGNPSPDDPSFLRHCVSHAYAIGEDDRRLRLALTDRSPEKAFDRLRREYPVRYEFDSYSVRGIPRENRELISRLAGLGFRLQ